MCFPGDTLIIFSIYLELELELMLNGTIENATGFSSASRFGGRKLNEQLKPSGFSVTPQFAQRKSRLRIREKQRALSLASLSLSLSLTLSSLLSSLYSPLSAVSC